MAAVPDSADTPLPRGSAQSPSGAASPERRPVPARLLAIASACGAALLALVAFVAYRELLYYERRAIEHVPMNAELALRVDLEQVVLFEPVRRHLLPVLDRPSLGDGAESPPSSRLVRLREAGLNLGLDLREVVFAQIEGGAGWVVAFGGIFGHRPLLPRIEKVLAAEPGARSSSERGMIVLHPSGVALGQADDGVLLLASDAALLERALPASRGYAATGLSPSGAAAFAALGSWLGRLGSHGDDAPGATRSLLRASARLDFGDPFELTADVEHGAPVDVDDVRREIEGWLGTPSDDVNFAPQADWGGERALAARARLSSTTSTRVSVRTTWERDELDRAARSLATWLEARVSGAPAAAR